MMVFPVPNGPQRALPFPNQVHTCCDDCACGPNTCPDCFHAGTMRVPNMGALGGFFQGAGLGDDLTTGTILDPEAWGSGSGSGSSQSFWDYASTHAEEDDSVDNKAGAPGNKPASGGGSSVSNFVSALATGLVRGNQPGVIAQPASFFSSPIGIGALLLGVVAIYFIAKKD